MKFNINKFKTLKVAGVPFFQVALGVGAVVLILLTAPQTMNMAKVSKETREKKKVLSDLDYGIKNFNTLEVEFNQLNDTYNDFVARLPLQREFPVFLELLSKLARESGVKIIAMEPQKTIDDPNSFFVKTPVLIDAYSGYHELGRFINEIEYSKKFMKINKMKITNADIGDGKQQIFLSILAYCLRDAENDAELH